MYIERKSKKILKNLVPKVKFQFPYVISLFIYTSTTFSHLKKKQICISNENIDRKSKRISKSPISKIRVQFSCVINFSSS